MKPVSPCGHGISAVVFEGVSLQIDCSGHVRRSIPQPRVQRLPHSSSASAQCPPSMHRREIWPW